jgi:hypothetical protein
MADILFEEYNLEPKDIKINIGKLLDVANLSDKRLTVICMKNQITIIPKRTSLKPSGGKEK